MNEKPFHGHRSVVRPHDGSQAKDGLNLSINGQISSLSPLMTLMIGSVT
ncbi:MAG: hypothetical protein MK214_02755 [Thalassotalea sp.]|nr:hypothetical protein [Thalassotalea sp.]